MRLPRLCAVFCAFTLASCAGGGSQPGSSLPSTGTPHQSLAGNVRVSLVIPNRSAQANARVHRQFVSPATQSVSVVVYAHTDTTHSSPLATNVANVSSGSSGCTSGTAGRTCTIALSSPAGNNDFVFALYDAAPVNGAIPPSAHELGMADVTLDVAADMQNVVNAPISAIVAAFGGGTQTAVVPSDGASHQVGLALAPADFDDQTITAGESNAPFANPITVSVSESGGSGHTLLSLDGGTAAASVTVSKATDTVNAVYDGKANAGYSATVTATAPAYGGNSAATENLQLNTLAVSDPTVFYAPGSLKIYPAGEQLLSIDESGAASSTTYTATLTGCSNVLQTGTVVGKGTNATLITIGGTQTSSSGCTLAIGDGTNTYTIAVTNQTRSAPGSSPAITEYSTTANGPFGITTGPDGNLWFTELNAASVDAIADNDSGFQAHSVSSNGFSQTYGISEGPDGTLWFGDDGTALIGSMTTAGTLTTYAQQTAAESAFPIAGLDGRVWFGESAGATIGAITPGNATPAEFPVSNGSGPLGDAIGSNAQVWFGLQSTGGGYGPMGEIQSASPNTIAQFTQNTTQAPFALALGSDGAIWFTEEGSDIGRVDASGTIREYVVPGSPSLNFITPGPDGALWFADSGNGAIGRITTGGTITEYPAPDAGAEPAGITVGPDGNIWFTDYNNNAVGTVVL